MTLAFSIRPLLVLAIPLGLGLWLAPVPVRAQTLDSGAGSAPSQAVSTPLNVAPINQPGAMRRAYSHPRATSTRQRITKPALPKPSPSTH